MKYGYRKPSMKSSVKARTTGKINRSIKKAVNPTYGKKGTGMIKNPKKSLYNRVYNKTTTSIHFSGSGNHSHSSSSYSSISAPEVVVPPQKKQKTGRVMIGFGVFFALGFFTAFNPVVLIIAILLLFFGIRRYKAFKALENEKRESE